MFSLRKAQDISLKGLKRRAIRLHELSRLNKVIYRVQLLKNPIRLEVERVSIQFCNFSYAELKRKNGEIIRVDSHCLDIIPEIDEDISKVVPTFKFYQPIYTEDKGEIDYLSSWFWEHTLELNVKAKDKFLKKYEVVKDIESPIFAERLMNYFSKKEKSFENKDINLSIVLEKEQIRMKVSAVPPVSSSEPSEIVFNHKPNYLCSKRFKSTSEAVNGVESLAKELYSKYKIDLIILIEELRYLQVNKDYKIKYV